MITTRRPALIRVSQVNDPRTCSAHHRPASAGPERQPGNIVQLREIGGPEHPNSEIPLILALRKRTDVAQQNQGRHIAASESLHVAGIGRDQRGISVG